VLLSKLQILEREREREWETEWGRERERQRERGMKRSMDFEDMLYCYPGPLNTLKAMRT
jgi:hypothetical protein